MNQVHCGRDHRIEDAPFRGDYCLTSMAVELEAITQMKEIPWSELAHRDDLIPTAVHLFSPDFFKGLQEIAREELANQS